MKNSNCLEQYFALMAATLLLSGCSFNANLYGMHSPSLEPTNPTPGEVYGLAKTSILHDVDYRDRYDDIAVDSLDRVFLVGYMGNNLVVRALNSDGTINQDFADQGFFRDPIQKGSWTTITIQIAGGVERLIVTALDPQGSPTGGTLRFYALDLNGHLIPGIGSTVTVDCKYFPTSSKSLQVKKSGDESLYIALLGSINFLNVIKISPTGAVDTSYGNQGIASVSAGFAGSTFRDFFVSSNGALAVVAYRLSFPLGFFNTIAKVLPNGLVDSSLSGGFMTIAESVIGFVSNIALDSSGNFILVADGTSLWIARYTPTGSLDTSFGNSGRSVISNASAYDISATSNNSFSIVGKSALGYMNANLDNQGTITFANSVYPSVTVDSNHVDDYAIRKIVHSISGNVFMLTKETKIRTVVRYVLMDEALLYSFDSTGRLNPGFNNGQIRSFSELNKMPLDFEDNPQVFSKANNDQIFVGNANLGIGAHGTIIASIHRNGQIDDSFGSHGVAVLPLFTMGQSVFQNDGSLFVGGILDNADFTFTPQIRKMTPEGAHDATYGDSGIKTLTLSSDYEIDNYFPMLIWVNDDESILSVALCYDTQAGGSRICIWKLTPDGELDPSFGTNGFSAHLTSTVIEPKFLQKSLGDLVLYGANGYDMGSMSFDAETGALKGTSSVNYDFMDSEARMSGVDANGRILTSAITWDENYEYIESAKVLRFNLDGSLDLTFNGGNGFSIDLSMKEAEYYFTKPAFGTNGSVAFAIQSSDSADHILVRLNEDGSLQSDFGKNGILDLDDIEELAEETIVIQGLYEKAEGGFMLIGNPYVGGALASGEIWRLDFAEH